jgi:hypothetical protein
MARAMRWAGGTTRVVRPTSSGWVGGTAKGRGQQRQRRRPEPVHPVLVLVAQLLQLAPVSGQRLLLGVGVVLVGPVAGDHHPGHRPITSQPPARLRLQRTHPTDLPAERAGVAEEAVQVDGDGQLGPDSAGLGELAGFQGAAGRLGEGIRAALATRAGVVGAAGAGQGFQRRQQRLAGLRVQQPVDGDHALPGRSHPQAALLIAPLGVGAGAVGVGDQPQVGDGPPQPGRVQPPGRRHQHWFGLGGEMGGQIVGAGSQHLGVGHRQLPGGQGLSSGGQGAAEQGSGGADEAAGGTGTHPQPGPQPGGGGADLDAVLVPGGPAGIHGGEFGQPVAFQAVHQPPQPKHPLGPGAIG